MRKASRWPIIVATVALIGLAAGLVATVALSRFASGDRQQPTLAPVAVIGAGTPSPERPQAATGEIASAPSQVAAIHTPQPATPTPLSTAALELSGGAASPLPPTQAPFIEHVVSAGENLTVVALSYGVSTEAIIAANNIANADFVSVGSVLQIPVLPVEVGVISGSTAASPTDGAPQPSATPGDLRATTTSPSGVASPPDWQPSVISGDLAANYPLVRQTGSTALQLHYQPGTAPAENIDALAETVDRIFARLQASMNGTVPQQVDVYLGGTLFGVNPSLQGFTQSYEFRSFVLVNGAFHPGERDYILGHELAHVAATHILGPASSTMIHEGLATYLPQSYLTEEAGYLPIEEICAAAYQTDAFRSARQLSQLSYGETAFGGHIRTFFNYNLSGCFVGYLIETYGMANLDRVYDSGNYAAVYGLSLADLDDSWQAQLATVAPRVDAQSFVAIVDEIAGAYEGYINASAGGYHANYAAYLHLNRARLEANRGNLAIARQELEQYRSLFESG